MALTHFPPEGGAAGASPQERVRGAVDVAGLAVEHHGSVVRLNGAVDDPAARERAILAAGNVIGIATVDDDLSVAGMAGGGSEAQSAFEPSDLHAVKAGETWERLADLRWGDPKLAPELRAANAGVVPEGAAPPAGWVVRVPRR